MPVLPPLRGRESRTKIKVRGRIGVARFVVVDRGSARGDGEIYQQEQTDEHCERCQLAAWLLNKVLQRVHPSTSR